MFISISIWISIFISLLPVLIWIIILGWGTPSRSLGCQKGHDYAYFWKHQIDGERNPEPKSCRINSWARIWTRLVTKTMSSNLGWGTTSRPLGCLKVHVRYCVRTYLLYGTAYCTVLRTYLPVPYELRTENNHHFKCDFPANKPSKNNKNIPAPI